MNLIPDFSSNVHSWSFKLLSTELSNNYIKNIISNHFTVHHISSYLNNTLTHSKFPCSIAAWIADLPSLVLSKTDAVVKRSNHLETRERMKERKRERLRERERERGRERERERERLLITRAELSLLDHFHFTAFDCHMKWSDAFVCSWYATSLDFGN